MSQYTDDNVADKEHVLLTVGHFESEHFLKLHVCNANFSNCPPTVYRTHADSDDQTVIFDSL